MPHNLIIEEAAVGDEVGVSCARAPAIGDDLSVDPIPSPEFSVRMLERTVGPLTGLAVGLGINEVSESSGAGLVAVVSAVVALAVVARWLLRLDKRAPMARAAPVTLLALSGIAAAAAVVSPTTWRSGLAICAATLVLAAAVAAAPFRDAFTLILTSGSVGMGAVIVGSGVAETSGDESLQGVADILFGVTMMAAGLATAAALVGAMFGLAAGVAVGVTMTGAGAARMLDGDSLGPGYVCLGLALTGYGICAITGRALALFGVAGCSLGCLLAVHGLVLLLTGYPLDGLPTLGVAAFLVGSTLAVLLDRERWLDATFLGLGIFMIGLAAALAVVREVLAAAVMFCLGVGASGVGAKSLELHPVKRLTAAWQHLTTPPPISRDERDQ